MTVCLNANASVDLARRFITGVLAVASLVLCASVGAQTLSPPIAVGSAANSAAGSQAVNGKGAPATAPAAGFPIGQGPGVHGANSPFPNLNARDDVVPWSVLTAVKLKREKNKIAPVFSLEQIALRRKTVRVQGFMMPLDPGEKQTHFLISSGRSAATFACPAALKAWWKSKPKPPCATAWSPW
jgi:uncharacterized protein